MDVFLTLNETDSLYFQGQKVRPMFLLVRQDGDIKRMSHERLIKNV